MPIAIARANAVKSLIRGMIEHILAHQKSQFGLFIRTIGVARAEAKLMLANLAYNFDSRKASSGGMSPPGDGENALSGHRKRSNAG